MELNLEYTEGQTPIDEAEKLGLRIKSISTIGELNEFEQQNIEEAMDWVNSRSRRHHASFSVCAKLTKQKIACPSQEETGGFYFIVCPFLVKCLFFRVREQDM